MKRIFIAIQLFMVFIAVSAQSFYPGMFDNKQVVAGKAKNAVQCFPLSDIRLLPSRFKDNMRRDSSWMISLPVASLVHSFQVTAGINSGREGGYMTVEKARWMGIFRLRIAWSRGGTFAFCSVDNVCFYW